MKNAIRAAVAAACIAGSIAVAAPAFASSPNGGHSWESWFLGARVNGHVQIQPSYTDTANGSAGHYHARQAYQRFTRASGPSLDTGRIYTQAANVASSTAIYAKDNWVWDSALWGDAYVTHYYWGINSWF